MLEGWGLDCKVKVDDVASGFLLEIGEGYVDGFGKLAERCAVGVRVLRQAHVIWFYLTLLIASVKVVQIPVITFLDPIDQPAIPAGNPQTFAGNHINKELWLACKAGGRSTHLTLLVKGGNAGLAGCTGQKVPGVTGLAGCGIAGVTLEVKR